MYKTRETVIKELKELFQVSSFKNRASNNGFEDKGIFHIDKNKIPRMQVIEILQKYFDGVGIEGGYLKLDSMTLLFTKFSVCVGVPK